MNDIEQKALALLNKAAAASEDDTQYSHINRRYHAQEALCRAIEQLEDLRQPTQNNVVVAAASADRIGGAGVVMDAEGVKLYWYRQGKDDGVEHERARIVAWLRGMGLRNINYIADDIEAGGHLK